MNCIKFETAAQQLLDERTAELPAELKEHFSACCDCAVFWNGQLWLLKASASATVAEIPEGMSAAALQQLMAAVSQQPASPRTVRRSVPAGWGLTAAISCAAALALMAVSLTSDLVSNRDSQSIATRDPVIDSTIADSESLLASQSLARLWNGVQTEYEELSKDTTATLNEMGELPARDAILPVVSAWGPALVDPPESWRRVDRPISERVEAAFDFLWDALPPAAPQSL